MCRPLFSLPQYNIDGMESLITRFFEIVDDLKRKTGDLLDYTKPTFDKDYIEFNKNIQVLSSSSLNLFFLLRDVVYPW